MKQKKIDEINQLLIDIENMLIVTERAEERIRKLSESLEFNACYLTSDKLNVVTKYANHYCKRATISK